MTNCHWEGWWHGLATVGMGMGRAYSGKWTRGKSKGDNKDSAWVRASVSCCESRMRIVKKTARKQSELVGDGKGVGPKVGVGLGRSVGRAEGSGVGEGLGSGVGVCVGGARWGKAWAKVGKGGQMRGRW